MSVVSYAFIKNNQVVNVAVFEDSITEEILDHFKNESKVDNLILANEKTAMGGTFDGTKFWLPQPYPSWIKGEEDWQAPVEMPVEEGKYFTWNEEILNWDSNNIEVNI